MKLIHPGQFAVFLSEAQTGLPRDREGWRFASDDEACVAVCDSQDEAAAFAAEIVTRHPEIRCEIYDHDGKANEPLRTVYHPKVRGKYEGLEFARRETFWGALVFVCGVGFVAADFARDLRWIWGYIIGVKCMLVGGAFLVRGLVGLYEYRGERGADPPVCAGPPGPARRSQNQASG
jgi:hypothetical protein